MTADQNLYAVLTACFEGQLDKPFLTQPGQAVASYRAIVDRASSLAGALRAAGVQPHDRVVTTTTKSTEAVALYLASLKVGAVYVPLNPDFTPAEIDYYVGDAEPSLMVANPGDPSRDDVATLTLDGSGGGTLAELACNADPLDAPIDRNGADPAAMLYT
ncbi:MAG: AMP-binding protein, partial [Acidimicrobiales bacterium]